MIYFDNAATGFPKDTEVLQRISDSFLLSGNPGRSSHIYSMYASEQIFNTREALANFFGSTPEKVILCSSATYALNMAIKGLYKKNQSIIISDMEHNSVIRPCYSATKTKTFEVNTEDDDITIKNFIKSLSRNTSLAVITHASNVCGRILPVKKIADICKDVNIPIILDASQTAGCLKIDLSDSNIDVICIPGHKGIYGPMGTGAMIINPKSSLHFNTIIEGGTGIMSADVSMPNDLPERLEAGTPPIHDFAGLEEAVKRCKFNMEYLHTLYDYTLKQLNTMENIILYGECKCKKDLCKYMPVILFNVKNRPAYELSHILSEKGVCTRSGFHCSPMAHKKLKTGPHGAVRLSIGKKNTMNDCIAFIDILREIILN